MQEQSPAATDLLRVCAFLSPDAIPEALLTQGAVALGPQLARVAGDVLLLNQAIEVLRAYSLGSRDTQTKSLSVHRLVQAVLKDGMKKAVKKQWVERMIRAVAESLPSVEHTHSGQWEPMVVQALVCAEYIGQGDSAMPEGARDCNNPIDGKYIYNGVYRFNLRGEH